MLVPFFSRSFNGIFKFLKLLIRFLGVGKNFRLLMQSCCFFFSRPFHENFKFLKNCLYDFHEILHSHFTPKGAPACAKASKSYGWDVRNIAKISPKMAKKQPFFDFFFDFLKNCPYDSNEIFYSHSTPYYGPLCAISLNSYGWDVRNIAKNGQKTVIFRFFRFSHKLSIRFERKRVRRKKT